MYKYIKGTTILSKERMSTAKEIARRYHLMSKTGKSPNGDVVERIIQNYINTHNYKISDYYYIYKRSNIVVKVYPEQFTDTVMSDFLKYVKKNNITMSKDKIYSFNNIDFIYYNFDNNVVNFKPNKRRSKNHEEMS